MKFQVLSVFAGLAFAAGLPAQDRQPQAMIRTETRVVLVDGGQHHAFGESPSRARQPGAPTVVGVVVALAPVQRHDYHRFASPEEHEALRKERVHDLLGVRHPATHASVADGNGDVSL